jgi:transposase-like protein
VTIGIDGTRHPSGVVDGATENAAAVADLLAGLRDRGSDPYRPVLVVIDGASALAAALNTVFDRPIVARCQLHKVRNLRSKPPKALAATVGAKMRTAYPMSNALEAEATLTDWPASPSDPPRRGREPAPWPGPDVHGSEPRRPSCADPHPGLDQGGGPSDDQEICRDRSTKP